jgi:hypothetical protein
LEEKNKNKKRDQMYGLGLNGPTCLELDKKKKKALPRILGLNFLSVSSTPIFLKKNKTNNASSVCPDFSHHYGGWKIRADCFFFFKKK